MTRRHFSEMSDHDWEIFNKDIKVLTGMLYTIAKPLSPFFPFIKKKLNKEIEVSNND